MGVIVNLAIKIKIWREKSTIFLRICLLLSLSACGEQTLGAAQAKKLVIWHDKEDAVIAALEKYLTSATPDLEIVFEKKSSLTDSLKLVGNDPSAAPDMFIFYLLHSSESMAGVAVYDYDNGRGNAIY